nr:hypothetical protein [uncultured Flavobacterium sp.]
MNTTDKRNGTFPKDLQNQASDRNNVMNEELYDLNTQRTQSSSAEDAERGYTVRDGHNPDGPNPDLNGRGYDEDQDDLNDDFHTDRDLEDNDNVYEVVLEEESDLEDGEDFDDDDEDLDEEVENDEFDNPADTFENDFNETEEDLEDIDDEDSEDETDYKEDDVQEDNDDEGYPENDPRRL